MSIYDDAELSQEEKERIRAEAAEATRQEAQTQQNLVQVENANLGAQTGAMGSSYQQPPDRPANTNPDNLADTEFRGSMDDSSYNYRMTNQDGTTALRENAGPDGEDEIIGPTLEQGQYEPSGYVPGSIQDPQVGSPLKPIADFVEPIQAGIHDWFTSEINSKAHIWGYDQIPRYSNMNNELQDAGRDATALLAPMLAYTRGAKGGLKKVHTSGIAPGKLQALGNDPLFKMFAGFGLDVGVGVYVDSTAYTQGQDHNFTGTLKDTWPETFKGVPNWLATSDNDSPDTKRHKNRQEGAGMNVLTELIGSLARVGKASWKSWQATRWVPKNEKATTFFAGLADKYKQSAMRNSLEVTAKAAEARQINLDDIGAYYLSKTDPNLPIEQPIKGVHDLWDVTETGMRSVDEAGVAGAKADVARIAQSAGTQYGRLGNFISSTALKYGLNDAEPEWLMSKVVDELNAAGEFDVILEDGTKMTSRQIDAATTNLAELLYAPDATAPVIGGLLKQMRNADGLLTETGTTAVDKALKSYMDRIYNLRRYQAEALTQTQSAGMAADNAETILDDLAGDAVQQLQEEMYDRVELLIREKAMTNWEQANTPVNKGIMERLNQFVKGKDAQMVKEHIANEMESRAVKLNRVTKETKNFIDTLRNIAKERPEFLKPLYEMYDATNGRVNSMYQLNRQFQAEIGDVTKAFYNGEPEIPSRVVRAGFSNILNSVLSGLGTPIRATVGNLGGLIQKPIGMIGGAAMSGDGYMFRRGVTAYGGLQDTFQKAAAYSKEVMWKLTTEPEKTDGLLRPDFQTITREQSQRLEALQSYAEAHLERGNSGPMQMFNIVKNMEDMGKHPVMRGSSNVMSSQDAFVGAFVANVQARAKAYDVVQGRLTLPQLINNDFDESALFKEAYDIIYKDMFDENGVLKDQVAKSMTGEIAMNMDMKGADNLAVLGDRIPITKTIFMFPRTQANMLSMFGAKYNPATPFLPGVSKFVDTIQDFAWKPLNNITPDEMVNALAKRGITDLAPDEVLTTFVQLRHEAKGRWAMGTLGVMGAATAVTQGRLTGDGHFDPAIQRAREKLPDYPGTRMYKVPVIEKWVSYEALGPIGAWISSIATMTENWNTIGETEQDTFYNKAAFLMASSLEDKTMMNNYRTALDIINGDEGAINRFLAGQINGFIPGAGQRSEWSKLFGPEQALIDRDIAGYLRNRNRYGDAISPPGAQLPVMGDWLYGKPIGANESWLTKAYNVYSPMPVRDDMGPEARFLYALEWNAMPQVTSDPNGIPYTTDEQGEIFQLIGQDGIFLEGVKRVMRRANRTGAIDRLEQQRAMGNNVSSLQEWQNIHHELNQYMASAVRAATGRLSTRDRLQTEAVIQNANDARARQGQPPLSVQAQNFLRQINAN